MSELLLCWRHAVQRSNVLHSLGNTSRHFRAVERPLSGRGSADQSEATEHWRSSGLFRVMRFILSRNTNGPENQVGLLINRAGNEVAWNLPHFFGQISNGLRIAGVSKGLGDFHVAFDESKKRSIVRSIL